MFPMMEKVGSLNISTFNGINFLYFLECNLKMIRVITLLYDFTHLFKALLNYGDGRCIRGMKWMWENKKACNILCFYLLLFRCFSCVWMSKGTHDVFVQWLSIFSSTIGRQNTPLLGCLKPIIQLVLPCMWKIKPLTNFQLNKYIMVHVNNKRFNTHLCNDS